MSKAPENKADSHAKPDSKSPDGGAGESTAKPSFKDRIHAIRAKIGASVSKLGDAAADSQALGSFKGSFMYLMTGVFARDTRTRITAWVFWGSLIGLVVVGRVALVKFGELRHFQKYGMNEAQRELVLREEAKVLAEREKRLRVVHASLGDFNFELVRSGGRIGRNAMNVAEIEIVIVCENREICDGIVKRIAEARNEITNALTPLDREELLSRDGKKRIKRRIIDRLHKWLGHEGLVLDVFFSRLVVT